MSKTKKQQSRIEVPKIGEPLENPNFVTPTAGIRPAGLPGFRAPISTDPFGSWTGQPLDPAEKPVQDADDL